MELLETPLATARDYAHRAFTLHQGTGLYDNLPNFDKFYTDIQRRTDATSRVQLRKDMPVANDDDLEKVKQFLVKHKYEVCDGCVVYAGTLHPSQRQIYFNKSIDNTARLGIKDTVSFLRSTHIYIASDDYIIDGHHRWLSGRLIGVETQLLAFRAHVPFNQLYELMIEWSDREGKERNV